MAAAIVSAALLAAIASLLFFHIRTGVPPFPARRSEVSDAIDLLREAGLPPNAQIYELGCGWGSTAVRLARAFPDARIVGIEWSPIPFACAAVWSRFYPNVEIRRGNFFDEALQGADAVTCYLMIAPMAKVAELLDHAVRPGTAVVAISFWFRDRQPLAKRSGRPNRGDVALYRWPAKAPELPHTF